MSVYPQFLQHIQDRGLYVSGYNYEEMYNIMVHTLTNNIFETSNFIYTYQQINELYDYLDELLLNTNESNESNQINEMNQTNEENNINNMNTNQQNQNSDTDSDLDDIYENDEEVDYSHLTPVQQLFANYIQNSTQEYQNSFNINLINTNIVYYNNI